MKRATQHRHRLAGVLSLAAAGLLGLTALTMTGTASADTGSIAQEPTCSSAHLNGPTRVGRHGGVAHPVPTKASCGTYAASDAAIGTPPLLFNGGPVMGTQSTGPVVVTPIYWTPAGHPMEKAYQDILTGYLSDVAAASGTHSNVYSTLNEYYGANGAIRYKVQLGTPITDTSPLPADGCKLNGHDTSRIYADGSGYDSCLDDAQVTAEIDSIVTAKRLPRDFGHIYVLFLPKHVESCFYSGSTTTASNFCTINYEPSAAYCAYHGQVLPSGTVYANMPFPVYSSPVGYTCGSDARFDGIQTPNGNADADTQVSPTSHEIMEAITDPDVATGWYDSSGYENGDECAYVYGATQGTAGQLYNQVIKRHRYLTQEEFSNADFFRTGGGCLQSE